MTVLPWKPTSRSRRADGRKWVDHGLSCNTEALGANGLSGCVLEVFCLYRTHRRYVTLRYPSRARLQKSVVWRGSRSGGRDGFALRALRADVRLAATRRKCAIRCTAFPPTTSVRRKWPVSPGALAPCARSDGCSACRRARAISCARLIPGQQSATSRLIASGNASGATRRWKR